MTLLVTIVIILRSPFTHRTEYTTYSQPKGYTGEHNYLSKRIQPVQRFSLCGGLTLLVRVRTQLSSGVAASCSVAGFAATRSAGTTTLLPPLAKARERSVATTVGSAEHDELAS